MSIEVQRKVAEGQASCEKMERPLGGRFRVGLVGHKMFGLKSRLELQGGPKAVQVHSTLPVEVSARASGLWEASKAEDLPRFTSFCLDLGYVGCKRCCVSVVGGVGWGGVCKGFTGVRATPSGALLVASKLLPVASQSQDRGCSAACSAACKGPT